MVAFRWSSDLVFLNADGSVKAVGNGSETIGMPQIVTYEVDPVSVSVRNLSARKRQGSPEP